MAEVRVYQTSDRTPLSMLRDDVRAHMSDMFPSFRSLVENVSIYNDEKEEILFFAATGALTYVKFIGSDREGSLDYVIDDYMNVQKRWARFCTHDKQYSERADEAIEMIIISDRFDDAFVKRIRFVSIAAVTLLEMRTLKGKAGEIAYSLDTVYSQRSEKKADVPQDEPERAPVEEPVVEKARDEGVHERPHANAGEEFLASKLTEENITERVVVQDTPQSIVVDEDTIVVTREEVDALQAPDEQKEPESDFFERAQLNAEEEREFFLLNQQLSESIDH